MRYALVVLLLFSLVPVSSLPDSFTREGYLRETGISFLHERGYDGTGVKLGIIDNGVDLSRFSATIVQREFTDADHPASQTHGTPVMGMVVDGPYASAPASTLFSAVLGGDPQDQGLFTNGSLIRLAFEWLMQQDVDIISVSWTGAVDEWSDLLPELESKGIFLVGAAGNTGELPMDAAPANTPYGISVGAMNKTYGVASFSAVGPYGRGSLDLMPKPDLVALGDGVESLNVGFGTGEYRGTSFSAPYVAGAIASLLEALDANGINWTVPAVKAALMASATDLGEPYERQGAGLLNVSRAFELLQNAPTVNGTPVVEYLSYWTSPFPKRRMHLPIQLIGTSEIVSTDFVVEESPLPFILPDLDVGIRTLWINTTLGNHSLAIEVRDMPVLLVNLSREIPHWFDGWMENSAVPYKVHDSLGYEPDLMLTDRVVDDIPALVVGLPDGLGLVQTGQMISDPVVFLNTSHFFGLDSMQAGGYPLLEANGLVPQDLYGNFTRSKDIGLTLVAGTAFAPYAFRKGNLLVTIDDGWLDFDNEAFFDLVMQELLQSHVDLSVSVNDTMEFRATNGLLRVARDGEMREFANGSLILPKTEGHYVVEAVNGSRYERLEFDVDVSAPMITLVNTSFGKDARLLFNGTDFNTVEVRADGVEIEFFLAVGNLTEVHLPDVNAETLEVVFKDKAGNYKRFVFKMPSSFNTIGNTSTPLLTDNLEKNSDETSLLPLLIAIGIFIAILVTRTLGFKLLKKFQ